MTTNLNASRLKYPSDFLTPTFNQSINQSIFLKKIKPWSRHMQRQMVDFERPQPSAWLY